MADNDARGDDTLLKLLSEHPDWDAYRRAMVDDRGIVLRIHVERSYGQPRHR